MDLSRPGKDEAVAARVAAITQGAAVDCPPSEVGAAPGINVSPGSDDDGWVVPAPIELADGTKVQLYKDGEALHAAYQAIAQARHRICLEVYIFASDETGQAFAELLCRKASEGVRVYVIYDSFGSIATDREMFQRMKRAGVIIEPFHPLRPWESRFSWRPFNRDHRKLLVIDNDLAGMGGLNIGGEYAGSWVVRGAAIAAPLGGLLGSGTWKSSTAPQSANPCDFWRDNAISIQGPAARHFVRSFARTWNYVKNGGRRRKAEFNHNVDGICAPDDTPDLAVLASVPTMASPLRPLLHTLFSTAKKSIQMTMAYFAPDDPLVDSLCQAAKRGVRVQLMLPARTDVHALMTAARSFYERLMTAGVEIYERQTVILHAKTMTIDGRLTVIGSTNLDYRSIEYNLELSSIIRSRKFGQQMHSLFHNDMRFAKRINLNEWRRRPVRDRLIQWAVSRARYLL